MNKRTADLSATITKHHVDQSAIYHEILAMAIDPARAAYLLQQLEISIVSRHNTQRQLDLANAAEVTWWDRLFGK